MAKMENSLESCHPKMHMKLAREAESGSCKDCSDMRSRRYVRLSITVNTSMSMTRKEKEAKKKQKTVEVKEVRLSPNIDTNDLNTKMNNAKKVHRKRK